MPAATLILIGTPAIQATRQYLRALAYTRFGVNTSYDWQCQ
jgi:hypothetical protein